MSYRYTSSQKPLSKVGDDVSEMKVMVVVTTLLFLIENVNAVTWKNPFITRYFPSVVLTTAIVTIVAALRVRRAIYRGD